MNLDRVSSGANITDEINVIIEIPAHSDPVKYEVDKETGAMFVDRFMSSAMFYPCNYGYVPHTVKRWRPRRRTGNYTCATDRRLCYPMPPRRCIKDD